jgi:hypothetical protein
VLVKSEVYILNFDTLDELLARILGAAGRIKKRENQLRRKIRELHVQVANCTEVDGGVFEYLL